MPSQNNSAHHTHTLIHNIRALHTKEQHEIFSEFFNMCSIPPAHVEVQKKRERETGRRKREGEMESMSAMGEQERERENPADSFPSNSP